MLKVFRAFCPICKCDGCAKRLGSLAVLTGFGLGGGEDLENERALTREMFVHAVCKLEGLWAIAEGRIRGGCEDPGEIAGGVEIVRRISDGRLIVL